MRRPLLFAGLLIIIVATLALAAAPAAAGPPSQQGDEVERGEYLATIAGCIGCHTPATAEGAPDHARAYAGGLEFDLGPLGKVLTSNLTSDEDTGLGNWTDDEIKLAIRAGIRPDGGRLFPIMPYITYSSMAEADLDAIVAYLRTLPAVKNQIEFKQVLPSEALPNIPIQTGLVAPDPANTAERGKYLLNSVIACTDCHTPVDQQTGAPIREKYFAGGQPYEGPWGIVYAANITPDETTGIGAWTDTQLKRVFREGVRIDGRRVVLMPWQEYTVLTDEDLNAVVHYLRNDVPAVPNQVPAAALNPGFVEIVPDPEPAPASGASQVIFMIIGLVVVAIGVTVMIVAARRGEAAGKAAPPATAETKPAPPAAPGQAPNPPAATRPADTPAGDDKPSPGAPN